MLTVITLGFSELPKAVLKFDPYSTPGGCSSMVERQLPKLHTTVRSRSPAPFALFRQRVSVESAAVRARGRANVESGDLGLFPVISNFTGTENRRGFYFIGRNSIAGFGFEGVVMRSLFNNLCHDGR